jgi:multiple sugar transport system permease protein
VINLRLRRSVGRHAHLTPAQVALLVVMLAVTLFPIYWMALASFKTNADLLGGGGVSLLPDPRTLQLGNYLRMWRDLHFGDYLRNSLIVCSVATAFAVGIASLSGFALGYFRFRGSGPYGLVVIATQLLPGILFLLPVYLIFRQIQDLTGTQMIDTYQGLILLYLAFFLPLSVWILRGYFSAIPRELLEAAQVDGASILGAFWRVLLPLSVPGLVATGTYVFLSAWDELLFASVMTNSLATQTVPVGVRSFIGIYGAHYDLLMAAATVACIPPAIIFLFLQRQMVSGLTAGAVK